MTFVNDYGAMATVIEFTRMFSENEAVEYGSSFFRVQKLSMKRTVSLLEWK